MKPPEGGGEEPAGANQECPERPSSLSPEELGFARQPMVRWLDPRQLVDTAARVVLSGIFGAYADKREMQALEVREVYDHSDAEELWVDYVADLGDGWQPTYTMATLLAAEKMELDGDGEDHLTQRGAVLVLGGDQVYPVPKRADYENRFLGPYRAALPCAREEHPWLFAVPGSHDWYDGLINFVSIFCRGHWIGGWRTRQSRSYFAVKLPHRWWIWGVDIQFGAYIDDAQLRYFSEEAAPQVEDGDRIILCTAAAPGTAEGDPNLHTDRNLDYFHREIVRPTGATVALQVTSGRHHYCRYEDPEGSGQHFTSGGGGAFLHPTHQLPKELEISMGDGESRRYELKTTYPSVATSKKLRKRLWLLPLRNPAFAGFLGLVHIVLAFMLSLHLREAHESLGLLDLWEALWTSPSAFTLMFLVLVLMGAMVRFAHDAPGVTRLLLGVAHSGLQLVSLAGVMMVSSRLSSALGLEGVPALIAFLALLGVVGGGVGSLGLAAYLWATNRLGFHTNEAYAPLRVMDFKHFLRLHIDGEGALTVFPIGVDRVCRRWKLAPDSDPEAPWLEPDGEAVEPRLIEAPVRIAD